jgi:hypothetical protein
VGKLGLVKPPDFQLGLFGLFVLVVFIFDFGADFTGNARANEAVN